MPNGECPVGAANTTAIVGIGRELGEMKARTHDVESDLQELTIRMERTTVKLGIIVAVIVGLLTTAGQIVIASLINGGG